MDQEQDVKNLRLTINSIIKLCDSKAAKIFI